MRLADSRLVGYMPLQHSGYKHAGFDLQFRACIVGVRVTDRMTGPDDVGTWIVDKDSVGDVHGGQLWKKAKRDVPMWRFATPVVIGKGATGGGTQAGHGGSPAPPSAGFVFGGVNTDFSSGSPQAGASFSGVRNDFSSGSSQAGASFTDPSGRVPDPNASTYGFRPVGSNTPGGSAPGAGSLPGGGAPGEAPQSDPVMNGGDAPPPTTNGGAPVATVPPTNDKCGTKKSPATMLPIMDEGFTGDDRLQGVPAIVPKAKKGAKGWPKMPDGMVGISLIGNDEDRQVDLFFPTDPRLISVNFAGDKDMGSLVFDLTKKFEIDGERGAPLQAIMRVVKKPMGAENSLAWQIDDSGCSDVHGGYVWARKNKGEPPPVPSIGTPGSNNQNPPVASGPGATANGFSQAQSPTAGLALPGGGEANGFSNAQQTIGGNTVGGGGAVNGFDRLPGNSSDPTPTDPANDDKPDNSTDWSIGRAARADGGPLDCGSGKCAHVVGRDGDGNPISKLHIAHNFLLRQDDKRDGPLTITDWKPGQAQSKTVPVNFGWNNKSRKWDWYSTTYMYFSPPPPPPPTPPPPCYPGYDGCPPNNMQPPCPPCSPMSPPPPSSPPSSPPCPPCSVATTGTPGGGMPMAPAMAGGTATPEMASAAPVMGSAMAAAQKQANFGPSTNTKERVFTGYTMKSTLDAPVIGADFGYAMTDIATASGEMLAKPYNYDSRMADVRYMRQPFENQGEKRAQDNPVTAVLAAFGAQGGSGFVSNVSPSPISPPSPVPSPPTPPPSPPAPPPPPVPSPPSPPPTSPPPATPYNTGSFGDPWNYTHKPSRARYRGGTAPGGFVLVPPEVGLEMIQDGLVPRSGIAVSEAYLGVGPGAKFFAAVPDLSKGRPKDGLSWGMDSSNGDLLYYSHFTGDAGVPAFRMGRTSQRFGFKSRSPEWGNFGHFNSSERTWIFPDDSGSVCVINTIVPPGPSVTAILGNIGGAGPAFAAQWGWKKEYYNGTYFYSPVWI